MLNNSQSLHYKKIEQAIDFINKNIKSQPSLDDIATAVHLSPFHLQRVFSQWAGVSPKKFLQYLTIDHAKSLLATQHNLAETASTLGLSGTSRLHDLFVNIEAMTPGEYKNGGKCLTISYSFEYTLFGQAIFASTPRGLCALHFIDDEQVAVDYLKKKFPNATYINQRQPVHQQALSAINQTVSPDGKLKLHLQGTPFQLNVWQSLLTIAPAKLTTYGQIAEQIGKPKASRAVGTAIGANPIALLIPCHRVIQASGKIGGYMWGTSRKSAIIGWESAQETTEKHSKNK